MSKKNIGSNFDDSLSENAMLDKATAVAVKRDHRMADRARDESTKPEQDHDGERYGGAGKEVEGGVDGWLIEICAASSVVSVRTINQGGWLDGSSR